MSSKEAGSPEPVHQQLPNEDGSKELSDQSKELSLEDGSAKEQPPEITFPEGGLRAWSVALGCSLILFSTFGYVNAFGVLQEYYQSHQLKDESPSAISWIGSLQSYFMFSGVLFGGPLFDRYGVKSMLPSGALYVFTVMMTSLCKKYYQFLLAQGILGGIAMGLTMAPGTAAAGQYFHKRRGAAMGLVIAGSSVGGVIFPIALSKMLVNPRLGFGWTIRICGFLILATLLGANSLVRTRLPPRRGRFFLLAAFKELPYMILIGAVLLIMIGLFTPFFYLPTYAIDHGMSTQLASYLVSILNGASFFGRVIPGIMADKLGRVNMLAAAGISTGVLIFCCQRMTTSATIILFSALYGFCSGAVASLLTLNLAHVPKNPRDIGTYMGQGMAIVAIGALIGPPSNGALVTRYGQFDQSYNMSGTFVVAGGLIVLLVKTASKQKLLSKS